MGLGYILRLDEVTSQDQTRNLNATIVSRLEQMKGREKQHQVRYQCGHDHVQSMIQEAASRGSDLILITSEYTNHAYKIRGPFVSNSHLPI